MKIVVYINSMNPSGGIERVVANLFSMLVEYHEVTFLVKDSLPSFYPLNGKIEIRSLNQPLVLNMDRGKISRVISIVNNFIRSRKAISASLAILKPDYVYVVSPSNAVEVLCCKRGLSKLIISEHGSYYGYNKIYTMIKKLIYPKAYRLIVPSRMDTEIYSKLGYPAEYIPHLTTFSLSNNEYADISQKRVLNIGRFTDDKRQLLLLEIWKNVVSRIDDKAWKLLLVGSGENKDRIEHYINANCLNDYVELLPPSKDIDKIYRSASIFAFTSRFEGFGMVLLEAMSFGLACISFDCPSGPRDVIDNELNGYLIKNGDVSEYIAKLILMINSRSQRELFSKNALIKIHHWDNKAILERWNSLLAR